jgi:hypothetical protein
MSKVLRREQRFSFAGRRSCHQQVCRWISLSIFGQGAFSFLIKHAPDADHEIANRPVWAVQRFVHSVNLSTEKSDLRIQLQMDSRYQDFISRAVSQTVLGYKMKVACVEDVFQGKIWAYLDVQRRKSKRQKDLADIVRLMEVYPSLAELLPAAIKERIE